MLLMVFLRCNQERSRLRNKENDGEEENKGLIVWKREVTAMMGSKERHFAPLIEGSVEQLVSQDHFNRHLERTLDLSFVREFVQETYANGGRPSIDPIVFFKLQLVMFFEDIVRCANRIY